MKRSKLVMSTALLSGAVFLTACDTTPDPEALNFKDLDGCYSQQPEDVLYGDWKEICNKAVANAEEENIKTAPRYEAAGDDGNDLCEAQHGPDSCYQYTNDNGDSFWMPFMVGYMISSVMNDNGTRMYNYNNTRPLYYSASSKAYFTSDGKYSTKTTYGKSTVSKTVAAAKATTPKVVTKASVESGKVKSFGVPKSTGGFGSSRTSSGSSRSFGG